MPEHSHSFLPFAKNFDIAKTLGDKSNDKKDESPQWHQDILIKRKIMYDQRKLELISLDELKSHFFVKSRL